MSSIIIECLFCGWPEKNLGYEALSFKFFFFEAELDCFRKMKYVLMIFFWEIDIGFYFVGNNKWFLKIVTTF